MSKNQILTKEQLDLIRSLDDFDLTMFLSEVHDFGVPAALDLLTVMGAGQ